MSRRAAEQGAVNVGQGFPDYPIDPRLAACVTDAVPPGSTSTRPWKAALPCAPPSPRRSWPPAAAPSIRKPRSRSPAAAPNLSTPPSRPWWAPGDEAIVFDPAYDAYDPAIRLAGGRCIHIPLEAPHFRYDWDRVRSRDQRAHAAHHHQQSAQSGVHRGERGGSRRAGAARRATGRSPCSPTKSTNTCSTTGACTSPS